MIDAPVTPAETPCKCCGAPSVLCGLVDLSRSGADVSAGKKVDPYLGIPVYYYGCRRCGFTFTRAFDQWTSEDFATHIYNDDYPRHDPDYLGARPRANADLICSHFPEIANAPALDFGSGQGLLEIELKARGFSQMTSYDPYTCPANHPALLAKYTTVFAFEVFEHHVDPASLVRDLAGLLSDDGTIFLSTLFVTAAIAEAGIGNWWYCAPRNGHISFYTGESLRILGEQVGLKAGSFDDGHHFMYRHQTPDWVRRYNHMLWVPR